MAHMEMKLRTWILARLGVVPFSVHLWGWKGEIPVWMAPGCQVRRTNGSQSWASGNPARSVLGSRPTIWIG